MKVVKFEDFKAHQRQTLASIFSFLGRKPLRSLRNKDRNIVPYERAMNWEERVFRYHHVAQDIVRVEQLLHWDCSDWKLGPRTARCALRTVRVRLAFQL